MMILQRKYLEVALIEGRRASERIRMRLCSFMLVVQGVSIRGPKDQSDVTKEQRHCEALELCVNEIVLDPP